LKAPLIGQVKRLTSELEEARAGATLLQNLLAEQKAGYEALISELEAAAVRPEESGRLQARVTELEGLLAYAHCTKPWLSIPSLMIATLVRRSLQCKPIEISSLKRWLKYKSEQEHSSSE
jgi:hypothetical protein